MNTAKLESIANQYRSIKNQIESLEEALKPLKNELEAACLEAPDMTIIVGPFKITLGEMQRENFKLKDAKQVLGSVLDPFCSVTSYTVLRVK